MRKVMLFLFIFVCTILLTACGVETNENSKSIYYVGSYNDRYYFREYDLVTNKQHISYLKDGALVKVEDISGYGSLGLVDNQVLLYTINYETRNIESYKLFNLDSLSYNSIDSSAVEGVFNVSYFDDEVIVFYSISDNIPVRFLVYDLLDREIIGDVSFNPVNYYRYTNVYYENNKLYVHFNYSSFDAENYDYIFDLDSEEITIVDSVFGNIMTIGNETLLFLESNSRYETKGFWVEAGSVEEDYFLSADYGSLKMYDGHIVEDQFYYDQIKVFNDEFMLINQLNLNYDCDLGMAISENELYCRQKKTFGSLIKSQKVKLIIYDFISKEVIEESDWIDFGSQIDNINE